MVERPLSMREVPGSMPGFSSDISSVCFVMTTMIFAFTEILLFYVIFRFLFVCFVFGYAFFIRSRPTKD